MFQVSALVSGDAVVCGYRGRKFYNYLEIGHVFQKFQVNYNEFELFGFTA